MSRDDNAMTQGLVAFLQGYGRNNREELSAIAKHESWPRLAALEYERRMSRLLESLPLDEVRAIARQKINLNELARQVLREPRPRR